MISPISGKTRSGTGRNAVSSEIVVRIGDVGRVTARDSPEEEASGSPQLPQKRWPFGFSPSQAPQSSILLPPEVRWEAGVNRHPPNPNHLNV